MKNLKRALCLVLVCVMTLGLMIMTTSAADFTDQDEIVNTDAVDTMVALNIINGKDDGSYFDPTGIVTRAEMCKMICVALNGGKDPQLGTTSLSYTDTNGHWAAGYIEYCTNLGIVAGRGNGIFDPTGTVTGSEAAKMLLVAIGYDPDAEGFTGATWEVAVNVRANGKNFYEDLEDLNPSAGLTRDSAAQMVYNAIQAVMVEYTYSLTTVNGSLQSVAKVGNVSGDKTILSDKFDMITRYATMAGVTSYDNSKAKYTYAFTDVTDSSGADSSVPTLKSTVDYSGFFGMNVKILYKNDTNKTLYGICADGSKVLASGVLNDIGTFKADSVKFGGIVYKTDKSTTATPVYYFNEYHNDDPAKDSGWSYLVAATDGGSIQYMLAKTPSSPANNIPATDLPYTFKFVDNDDDGKVDCVVALPFTVAKVTYVGSTSFTAGGSYTFENVDTYDGIAKNDYAIITAAANTAKGRVAFAKVDTVVSGKATSTNTDGTKLTVGGTSYNVYTNQCNNSDFGKAKVGNTYQKMQVVNGFVFYGEASATVASGDFAVVVAIETSHGQLNTYPQVKLLLTDGTKIVVDYDKAASKGAGTDPVAQDDLVAYDKDSDNVYTLTQYSHLSATADTDFDGSTAGDYKYAKDGKSTIGTYYIDDDAVIFYKNASSTWKVTTGAQLKKSSDSSVGVVGVSYYSKNSSTGLNTIALSYIPNTTTISDSNTFYGYLTADATLSENDDGDTVNQITFWNGTEKVTKLCSKDYTSTPATYTLKKNDVITYTLDDGAVKVSACAPIKATAIDDAGCTAAITAYSASAGVLNFKSSAHPNTDYGDTAVGGNYEITDDTVIIYVDVANAAGVNDGEISKADETDVSGTYYCNAFFYATGTDLDLLIVDISNDICDVM